MIEARSGRVVCDDLIVADRFWPRLVGLQFRRGLAPGQGLLLTPCSSVHTLCMRFALDLAMLDEGSRVVEVRRGVRPWRIVLPRQRTHAVLELAAGTAAVEVGDLLEVEACDAC